MKEELNYIGQKIINNRKILANSVTDLQKNLYDLSQNNLNWYEDTDNNRASHLIELLGKSLIDKQQLSKEIVDWAKTEASYLVDTISLTQALRSLAFYRTVIWDVFTEELEQQQFAALTMLDVSKIIDPLLDEISAVFGEVFQDHSNKLMKIAYTALEELSVPVVPINKNVAVVPLIGEIDTHRSQLILEVTMEESSKLKLEYLILDVTGVPVIDTMVADNLFKVIYALKLLGVETIITGIRPEIAQTIVSIGVNFKGVTTFADLPTALSSIDLKVVHQN
ncbi:MULTISPECIES: STAS domain-containing protein [Metabacillus]|uniref:Modulator protein n=2 Tax=Metabacillus TaxID=2675233 RepID=A0A179SNY6_9BACI|nr:MULTISPECIES: STAS domain-containing protein [Metabacillus]OAS83181.1 modulator protein [Metabacillus litoralis]QNF29708.1 STAS domain-containing protein [Metabacillus sp. KUDC1714]